MDFGDILDDWDAMKKREAKNASKAQPVRAKRSKPSSAVQSSPSAAAFSPKRAARKPEVSAREALAAWLDGHGVQDKDESGSDEGDDAGSRDRGARIAEAERIRLAAPRDSIDLHGMHAAAAENALRAFLVSAAARGYDKVLVVHGKGNHSAGDQVLGAVVRRVLESSDLAGSFGYADRESGGRGATWVAIRKHGYISR